MLHFYEGQVRKFLTQFIRILSNFSVETGKGSDGAVNLGPENPALTRRLWLDQLRPRLSAEMR